MARQVEEPDKSLIESGADYWLSELDFAAIPAQEVPVQVLTDQPTVTVLMLAWNHAEFIDQAIESIVTQQCGFPFELIIGEDHSTDATRDRCHAWQEKFPGIIRIVTADQNVGMHRNFARIWHRARGEFIALCEGDDYWVDPGKLQKQLEWFTQNSAGTLVGTFTERITEAAPGEWTVSGRWAPFEIKALYDLIDLLRGYSFHFSSVMLRKESVRFPRWFWDVYCVDRPLYLLAAQHGTAGLLPIVASHYRQHPAGLWSPRSPLAKGAASAALFHRLEAHFGAQFADICRQTLFGILWSYMSEAIEAGDWLSARTLYWQALRAYPRGLVQGGGRNACAAWLRIHFPAFYKSLRGKAARLGA